MKPKMRKIETKVALGMYGDGSGARIFYPELESPELVIFRDTEPAAEPESEQESSTFSLLCISGDIILNILLFWILL